MTCNVVYRAKVWRHYREPFPLAARKANLPRGASRNVVNHVMGVAQTLYCRPNIEIRTRGWLSAGLQNVLWLFPSHYQLTHLLSRQWSTSVPHLCDRLPRTDARCSRAVLIGSIPPVALFSLITRPLHRFAPTRSLLYVLPSRHSAHKSPLEQCDSKNYGYRLAFMSTRGPITQVLVLMRHASFVDVPADVGDIWEAGDLTAKSPDSELYKVRIVLSYYC